MANPAIAGCDVNAGGLVSVTGDLDMSLLDELGPPPNGTIADLTNDALVDPSQVFVFSEREQVPLLGPIAVGWSAEVDSVGVTYGGATQPSGGSILANTIVTSHILHLDTLNNPRRPHC